jgi:nicotinamidase-related amidase
MFSVSAGINATVPEGRSFASADAKGGKAIVPATTALVMIEYQNEFTSEGGKLHDAVKSVMEATNMLANSVDVCAAARQLGALVIHAPISFAQGGSDNPNKGLGILKGCADGELFQAGTWNAEICEAMAPSDGDLVVSGKKGLDAFPGTDLEKLLLENKIETVALGGFLTNCCVESTMRTACEKGFNVVTLTDCTAATSMDGQVAATEGTYGMFSTPMKKDAFLGELHSQ